MGRPRKRRREGESNELQDHLGPFEFSDVGTAYSALQASHTTALPHYSPGGVESQLIGNGNRAIARTSRHGQEQAGLDIQDFDVLYNQDYVIDPLLDFTDWENIHDDSNSMPDPSQLQTPPTVLEQDGLINRLDDPNSQKACSCLPNLYTTLGSFQSVPPPSFPFSMALLKKAARLAHTVAECQVCPESYNTAVQNTMLLGTLMQMLINEYARLLTYVDQRSTSGETFLFRVGEPSSSLDHRHTGGPDCPMSISINLSGDEWRVLAKKAVRQEIHGGEGMNSPSVISIIEKMKSRQWGMHQRFACEVHAPGHERLAHESGSSDEQKCLQIDFIQNLQKSMERLSV